MLETKSHDGVIKSTEMRLNNANRAKLSPVARQVYLQGYASLSKAEGVAAKGNESRGFILPNVVVNLTFAFLLQNNDEIIIIDISRRLDFGIQLSCL